MDNIHEQAENSSREIENSKKKKKTRIWMEIKHMLTEIKNDFTRDISRLGTPEEILVNLIN